MRWVFAGAACTAFAEQQPVSFASIKRILGFTEAEASKELAMWLGHDPHRTKVTYAYGPGELA